MSNTVVCTLVLITRVSGNSALHSPLMTRPDKTEKIAPWCNILIEQIQSLIFSLWKHVVVETIVVKLLCPYPQKIMI